MQDIRDINNRFRIAVHEERVETVKELINRYGLSNLEGEGYVLLRDAVEDNSTEIAQLFLVSNSRVNNNSGRFANTPLHYAVINGNKEIITLLLNKGANVNALDEYRITPLHIASEKGYQDVVQLLLNYGADIRVKTEVGLTPLHIATRSGHRSIVQLFLKRGSDVDNEDNNGQTILNLAVERNQSMIVQDILNYCPNINNKSNTNSLKIAVHRNNENDKMIIEALLNYGFCVNAEDIIFLHAAIKGGYLTIVESQLQYITDINALFDGFTPLHIAVKERLEDISKLLISYGADVNAQDKTGKTPIFYATENADIKITNLLLTNTANIKNDPELLRNAVKGHSIETVKALLHYGADVNAIDKYGMTALHYTADTDELFSSGFCVHAEDMTFLYDSFKRGYLTNVESRLQYISDINTTFKGFTPLHIAVRKRQEDISKLLISYGADVNARDKTGKTPIFYAIKNTDIKITNLLLTNTGNVKNDPELLRNAVKTHRIEIVKALLHYGADVNAIDKYGMTALHYTADMDELFSSRDFVDINTNVKAEIAKLLLSKGANVDAQTEKGLTTLQAAAGNGYVEVVEVLLQHDADINLYDINRKTALHLTVMNESENFSTYHSIGIYNIDAKVKIAVMLLNKGANVDAQTKNGITALHAAAHNSFKNIVETLLEYNANVNCRMINNLTPLLLAAQRGSQEIIEILLKSGADVNSTDDHGKTALLHACQQNNTRDVRKNIQVTLLEYGSDINIACTNNETPLNYVMKTSRINSHIYINNDIIEVYHHHIVKLKIAKLYVSEQNLQLLRESDKIIDFTHECRKEILCMKTEKINYTNFSFYDILAKDTNLLTMCMRNENIVQVLESENYKTKFPIYASMIKCQFRKGMYRKELLEKGNPIFNFLFNNFPELPYICIEKILNYLNDVDLRIFVNAYLSSLRRNIKEKF